MGINQSGLQTPDTTSAQTTGKPYLKVRDGALSVSAFSKARDKGDSYIFIVAERAYKKGETWVNTSTLHVDDLLSMAFLMMQVHAKLKTKIETQKKE